MLQPAIHLPTVALDESGPTGCIQPTVPYVFAFALGRPPAVGTRIRLGTVVTIAVADGTRTSLAPHDWFAARVPVIPAVTGPVHVNGVRAGDVFEINVISLEPEDPGSIGPFRVSIAPADRWAEQRADQTQSAVPAGGVVRVTDQNSGGLISFGPVVSSREREADPRGEPVAARISVRCRVVQSQGI